MSKLIIICMVGAPCSGKSTWVKKKLEILHIMTAKNVIVISLDQCRDILYGPGYDYKKMDQSAVIRFYNKQLSNALATKDAVIILDNTHMRASSIKEVCSIVEPYWETGQAEFYLKLIEVPYYVVFWRNVKRRILTGKWIPMKVLKDFYGRYETLQKDQFVKNLLKRHSWTTNSMGIFS